MRTASSKSTGRTSAVAKMLENFRQLRMGGKLISLPEVFPAKESALATIAAKDLKMNGLASGESLPEPLAFFDQGSLSWRTCQRSLFEGLELYSEILPRSGTMRNGILYPRGSSAPLINEREFSLWPTPQASDAKRARFSRQAHLKHQARQTRLGFGTGPAGLNLIAHCQIEFDGFPTTIFVEWLMGFPPFWTRIESSETPLCRK